tara:strand:- start:10288 stop:10545 length:258 start_codon:yes stop_codon:yes gene_type:complete
MDSEKLEDAAAGPQWMNMELPIEMDFECESVIRRVDELTDEQTIELIKVCLRHNFRLVNMLRQSIDRVAHLEAVIDDLCEADPGS